MSLASSEGSRLEIVVKTEPKKQTDSTPASPLVKVDKENVSSQTSTLRTTALHLLIPTIYVPAHHLYKVTKNLLAGLKSGAVLRKTE